MNSKNNSGKTRFPDARVKAVRGFLDIVRNEQDWTPDTVTKQTFETLDLAPSKETNAIFAIRFLGIIDGNGTPTEEFNNLREDYSNTLNKLVMSSYVQVFNTIPKNLMVQRTIVNFFMQQGYVEDTAEYQAKLFVALCDDAGIDLPNVEPSFRRARFEESE